MSVVVAVGDKMTVQVAVADSVLVRGAVVGVDKSVLVRVIVALSERVGNHKNRTSNHYQ